VSGYVPEDPLALAPGVAELLADPNHYKRTPMEVVDYSDAPLLAEDVLPSLTSQPEPEAPGRWQRFRAWLTREAAA
jgi:hypothetical protein